MSNYGKGARLEIEVRDILIEDDWVAVRSAGSHGIIDVLAVKQHVKWFIQCRIRGNLSGEERSELIVLARKHSAIPILACEALIDVSLDDKLRVGKKKSIVFKEIKLLQPDFHFEVINGRFIRVDE